MASPACTGNLKGHRGAVLACAPAEAHHLLASGSEDGCAGVWDLRTSALVHRLRLAPRASGEAVPSVAWHPGQEHTLFAACGARVLDLDLRQAGGASAAPPVAGQYEAGWEGEEVAALAVDGSGAWLGTADDGGAVALVDLAARRLRRTLRRGHSSLCSSVAFRAHRAWEVISGGLDSTVVRWNFSSGRPQHVWQMGAEAAVEGGGQLLNPPMVHCVAAPATEERPFARLLAAARGDGKVAVYDGDVPAGQGKQGACGTRQPQRKGSARQRRQPAGGAQPGEGNEEPLALLDLDQGGHSAAVGCVTFPAWASARQLLSGGNDARILLWDWLAVAVAGPGLPEPFASLAPAEQRASLICQIVHGSKVNGLATLTQSAGAGNVIVADTSNAISVYNLS